MTLCSVGKFLPTIPQPPWWQVVFCLYLKKQDHQEACLAASAMESAFPMVLCPPSLLSIALFLPFCPCLHLWWLFQVPGEAAAHGIRVRWMLAHELNSAQISTMLSLIDCFYNEALVLLSQVRDDSPIYEVKKWYWDIRWARLYPQCTLCLLA